MDFQDHHFVPCFYTRRWTTGSPATLCEFRRPFDVVKPKRVAPKGTGYVNKLYALGHLPPEQQQELEKEFFKPIDTRAADALAEIEKGVANDQWKPALRLAWVRFLMTLLMRMPADMELMKASYSREFSYVTEQQRRSYQQRRHPSWPPTFDEALRTLSKQETEDQGLRLATILMRNQKITDRILAMHWTTLDTSSANWPLLTSDRPVQVTGKLGERATKLIVPVGPNRLYVGTFNRAEAERFLITNTSQLVSRSNRAVTQAAVKYVYGVNDEQLGFVSKHFGHNRPKSLLEMLVDHIARQRGPDARMVAN